MVAITFDIQDLLLIDLRQFTLEVNHCVLVVDNSLVQHDHKPDKDGLEQELVDLHNLTVVNQIGEFFHAIFGTFIRLVMEPGSEQRVDQSYSIDGILTAGILDNIKVLLTYSSYLFDALARFRL